MNATTRFPGSLVLMNLFAVAAASGAIVTSFDLEKQFSTNGNPNGPWSYGSKSNYAGVLAVVTENGIVATGDGVPIEYWNAVFGSPVFYHNATTNTGHNSDEPSTWPPNVVIAFPGDSPESHYGVVRFATPGNSNGLYRLEASARSYIDGPAAGDTDYAVLLNGAAVFSAALPGQGQTAFTNIYFLSAGSTLDFAVGPGADGSTYASGLKLSARLFYLSNSPPRPTISAQPQSVTNRVTSNVTFSVVALPLPLAYQWRRSGAALPGQTNQLLVFTNLTGTEAGSYTVVASNSAGSVTSAVAVLTIDKKPRILTQPQAARLPQGWNAYFDVSAEGPPPLRFQWRRSGTAISGATNAQYVRTNLTTGGAGNYTVVVSNDFGAVTSAVTVLTVPTGAAFDVQRDFALTNPNFAWSYGSYYVTPFDPFTVHTNLVSSNGKTLEAWLANTTARGTVILHNPSAQNATYPGPITYPPNSVAFFAPADNNSADTTIRLTLPPGGPGVYQLITSVRLHSDGPLVSETSFFTWLNDAAISQNWNLTPGDHGATNLLSLDAGDTVSFTVDSFGPFETPSGDGLKLSATLSIWTNGIPLPNITTQPISASPRENGNASFSVQATGTQVLRYQWLFNGSPLAGATAPTLSVYGVQPANAGAYRAVVRNNGGAVTSAVAMLSIDYSPIITSQPQPLNRQDTETAEFDFVADGMPPLRYQWQYNGHAINGATNGTLVLSNLQVNQTGDYTVVVSNSLGQVLSVAAHLEVTPSPVYDPAADFHIFDNPTGVWSYGFYAPPDRSFVLVPYSGVRYSGNVTLQFWSTDYPPGPLAFYHNATSTPGGNNGISVYAPGALVFFPGPSSETSRAVVRLTIPAGASGTYQVETKGQPHSDGATFGDLKFQLVVNGKIAFARELPGADGFAVTNQYLLLAGETVDFTVATSRTSGNASVGLNLQTSIHRVAPFINPSLWARQTNGTVEIHVQGDPNRNYQLLSSIDFAVWTPVSAIPHTVQDHLAFTVPTTNSQKRFYRVVTP